MLVFHVWQVVKGQPPQRLSIHDTIEEAKVFANKARAEPGKPEVYITAYTGNGGWIVNENYDA